MIFYQVCCFHTDELYYIFKHMTKINNTQSLFQKCFLDSFSIIYTRDSHSGDGRRVLELPGEAFPVTHVLCPTLGLEALLYSGEERPLALPASPTETLYLTSG